MGTAARTSLQPHSTDRPCPRIPTSEIGQDMSLVWVLLRWTLRPRVLGYCCPYHHAVAAAKSSVRRLRRMACRRDFEPLGNAQCDKCYVLDMWSDEDAEGEGTQSRMRCSVCGDGCVK